MRPRAIAAAIVCVVLTQNLQAQRIISPAIPVQSPNTEYIKAVHKALELLRERSPADFEFARAHVARIEEVSRWEQVGMAVMDAQPTARLRRQDVMGSATWLASDIVHEACHRFQYLRGVHRHGMRFPPNYEFSGRLAELECLERQAQALERLNAPAQEIVAAREADGLHYRRNEYGNYYKAPPPGGVWWDPSASDPREPRNQH